LIGISYTNSGKTWLKSMTNYIELNIPYTHQGTSSNLGYTFLQIKNQIEMYPEKLNNILFLHRDPRDVIISNYFQTVYRNGYGEHLNLSDFIKKETYGIEKCIQFNLYIKELSVNKLSVSYEDLKKDTKEQLHKICKFFNYYVDDIKIEEAYNLFSFDKMKQREIEKDNSVNTFDFTKIYKRTNRAKPESFKTRRGIVGGYKDYLSESDIKYCNDLLEQYYYFERMNA